MQRVKNGTFGDLLPSFNAAETSPDESGTVAFCSGPAATSLNASVTSTGRVCVRVVASCDIVKRIPVAHAHDCHACQKRFTLAAGQERHLRFPVDHIIIIRDVIAGGGGLTHLQHLGGSKFVATINSAETTKKLIACGSLRLGDIAVPLEQVRPRTVYRPTMYTGMRVVRIEMKKAVSNFIHAAGHSIMFEYWGMKRVCARCGPVFSHNTDGCASLCNRCGQNHATRNCTKHRSNLAVTQAISPPDPGVASAISPGSHNNAHDVILFTPLPSYAMVVAMQRRAAETLPTSVPKRQQHRVCVNPFELLACFSTTKLRVPECLGRIC
ncbi:hypothetical protein HPB47_022505 [Ixodes persulcatus]|uniref:Uncharacterized protein n=1 Tax=Ixodes persulcatus TaxID=34615 RepID=A0AC60QAL8_IXOPE|nr:hypothetical protein HPB47_022505 [Ixodes persulcatus]